MLTPSFNQLTMPVVWLIGLELRLQTDLVMVCSVAKYLRDKNCNLLTAEHTNNSHIKI